VIELKTLGCAASHTLAAKHLDEALSAGVLVGLDVLLEILGSPARHLTYGKQLRACVRYDTLSWSQFIFGEFR
jgi:hypothetical protein